MPETPQDLLARIQPLFDAIDLDTIDANASGCIQAGELSGKIIPDDAKRSAVLKFNGVIILDEASTKFDLLVEV